MAIEEIRKDIEDTDRQIMELVLKRLGTASEIGREKKREGLPVRAPEVEEKVIGRYREFAESNGIDPDDMGRLGRLLIEMSVKKEE